MLYIVKDKFINYIKKDFVLIIAIMLAIASCFLVPISKKYIDYIDFRVLSLLFCLMIIVAGFRSVSFFDILSHKLFQLTHTVRSSALVFILLCYFTSMIITNDVALILFVPFSIYSIKNVLSHRHLIFLIVLETIAANLGSMFTPIGNPQNLFIFTNFKMSAMTFFTTMFPYSAISLVILMSSSILFPKTVIEDKITKNSDGIFKDNLNKYICFTALFILTITTVARITPALVSFMVCVIVITFIDPKLFRLVDYSLIFTFTALFIFVGNMGQITIVQNAIGDVVTDNEVLVSIFSSQFISNVPATLLLSNFTNNATSLLIGVNLGGLGTMIASMASLISYKIIFPMV